MNNADDAVTVAATRPAAIQEQAAVLYRRFFIAFGALALLFSRSLYDLVLFALDEKLYSHIVLIPFVSLVLIVLERKALPAAGRPDRMTTSIAALCGLALVAWYWWARLAGASLELVDRLALTTLSLVAFLIAICGWFLGRPLTRALAFPLGFLVFMSPLPTTVVDAVETFLQHGSAFVALVLFRITGTPLFQHGLVFDLPGISIQVAPECSGIHSTMALMMTSLLAGHLFLRSCAKRVLLAFAVIPLALVRNGFRIFTIGELCVHVSPTMIDSPIHHEGGPIFFALSLVPFFVLLWYLMKTDRASHPGRTPAPNA